jgi:hypothetical protein
MPNIKLAVPSHFPLPANLASRGGMMRGCSNDLKDHAAVEDRMAMAGRDVETSLIVEQIAQEIAGIPAIGQACRALEAAGRHATIAGNRITVDHDVFAQFIAASMGQFGHIGATWVIYTVAGTPPVWIVGAEPVDDTIDKASFGTTALA